MSVVCLASLKGGVGKTAVSINLAASFAARGCKTLLIDLDPTAHSSRFFSRTNGDSSNESPLARLLLSKTEVLEPVQENINRNKSVGNFSLVELAITENVHLLRKVRENLWLIPAGNELRHFYWGRSARLFRTFFPILLAELLGDYDYVVVDTPPDYNILTRNGMAVADLVVVPVDASLMSIHCLEDLVEQAGHIEKPIWSIVRTMVNRQAKKVRELSEQRIGNNLNLNSVESSIEDDDEDFIMPSEEPLEKNENPIYLFNSQIYRTEIQNKLSFQGKTVFESKETKVLAPCYLSLAREIEELLSIISEKVDETEFLPPMFGSQSAL